MTPAELYAFLRKHRLAVISTIGATSPQAAVIGIAVTPALDIIFDTLTTSRKYANLQRERILQVVSRGRNPWLPCCQVFVMDSAFPSAHHASTSP